MKPLETNVAAVKMRNITKTFGPVVANDKVWLDIYKGEILALLGENGSGKTTLMNMLSGIYYPDEGDIYINDEKVVIRSPKDAFRYNIGMIHQHFKLIDVFTAAENIVLGLREEGKYNIKDVNKAKEYLAAANYNGEAIKYLTHASGNFYKAAMAVIREARAEQQRKAEQEREQNEMRNSLCIGDEITTIGGIIGTVVDVKENNIVIETSADQVRIELAKWALSTNETAAEAKKAEAKKAQEAKAKAKAAKK